MMQGCVICVSEVEQFSPNLKEFNITCSFVQEWADFVLAYDSFIIESWIPRLDTVDMMFKHKQFM